MEEVECSECGNRYDSQHEAFCPRCGNIGTRSAGPVSAARFDPRRRRVQMGGIILIATGAMMLLMFGSGLAGADDLVAQQGLDILEIQPGGDVIVVFTDGAPVAGVDVVLSARNGTQATNGTTDADGRIGPWDMPAAVSNVTLTYDDRVWQWQVVAIQGSTTTLRLDAADAATGTVGAEDFVALLRVTLAFFIAISVFVLGGGIAAVRLRQRNIAIGAGIVGLIPILMLAVAVFNIATLLLLFLMTSALGFIIAGRRHFQ